MTNQTEFIIIRFYLGRGGQAVVKMVDAEFEYTYEYQVTGDLKPRIPISQGNAAGLVYTELIEKCYLTLTQVKSCRKKLNDMSNYSGDEAWPWREPLWPCWNRKD